MQVVVPEIAQNVQTAEILALFVRVGQHVLAKQPVLELEAGKSSFELPSPATGKIEEILVGIGDDVQVGDVVLTLRTAEDQRVEVGQAPAAPARPRERVARALMRATYVRASPAARRRARELGVDIDALAAMHDGRVTIDQIEAQASATAEQSDVWNANLDDETTRSVSVGARDWRSVPQVALHRTIDVTCLEAARRRYRDEHESGPRLTLTAFVLKACGIALREHPRMNSSLIRHGRALAVKRYVHLGVFVDPEYGPTIQHADQRPLCELAAELETLTGAATHGRVPPRADQLEPATFSITNLRSFGGTRCTPMIHPPQVGALGLCRTRQQGGRTLLPLSLAYDQRVNDEPAARAFLDTLAELLRDPMAMLMRS